MQLSNHQEELATRGYTIVPDVLSAAEVTELREIVDALYQLHDPGIDFEGLNIAEGRPDGRAPERGAFHREYNFATCLLTRHSAIWPVVSREPILSLIRSIIGPDCVLSSLNSLEPLPGHGQQPLHRDEGPAGPEGYVTANSIWVLDAMDAGNGSTRLIPGTHTTAELSDDADPRLTYANAAAGSVVVTNAHVLHGASINRDGRRRRVIHGYFTRRGRKRQTDFRYYSSPASIARLPASCRALLDLD
ncbi:MAG TPA: phytanoyl-CoA dioxygenase family protein [Steroidobacteraceae bacterium]|nr:phytanoyl-CoA dioxygenase family protein [Steroidobacteraceae bacterium]